MYSKQPIGLPYASVPSPRRNVRQSSESSDITMSESDFSLAMEYSESSDDVKDGLSPSLLDRGLTGSSTFRRGSDIEGKNSRVVRFGASAPPLPLMSSSYDDGEYEDDDQLYTENSEQEKRESVASSSTLSSNVWKVVSNVAHAVNRSPHPSTRKESPRHVSQGSRDTMEYPHHVSFDAGFRRADASAVENSPLLPPQDDELPIQNPMLSRRNTDSSEKRFQMRLKRERAITIAASFLMDYEGGRPPSLPSDVRKVTNVQVGLHQVMYSVYWKACLRLAGLALFVSSCFEGNDGNPHFSAVLNFYSVVVLAFDLLVTKQFQTKEEPTATENRRLHVSDNSGSKQRTKHESGLHVRQSRTEKWRTPLTLFLVAVSVETALCTRGFLANGDRIAMWSSALKPVALFYISTKARDALEALNSIAPIVIRVIVMELFLILCFAAVACRLYNVFDSFQSLSTSFVSLFELSTTVVNPSLWMPMYGDSRSAAIFFVIFVVTSVFYLHSLVLSVVFQSYIQAATEIHDRNVSDREDDLKLAFMALQTISSNRHDREVQSGRLVSVATVRRTLKHLRPHYNTMKINALVQILDPGDQQFIDFPSFRTKIRQSLNASIRSTRSATTFSLFVELVAAVVAASNFIYVILLTSAFQAEWLDAIEFPAGCVITLLGVFDLISRFDPCKYFTPMTRLSGTFDGLAALAALVSCKGIYDYFLGNGGDFLLMGRAIDMIRIMRFFKIFREIIRRSSEVFPALLGPLVLVVSTIHIYTYAGMALWGGAVEVGSSGSAIEPLYDLNNFNSYLSGIVTTFQVLVVNDWHAIAEVFLHAERNAEPYIVFPFFIGGNLVMVSIVLNVLTAFFVGTFVTKLTQNSEEQNESTAIVPKSRDFDITGSSRPVKRVSSEFNVQQPPSDDNSSISTPHEQIREFDVFEREGYDKIMQTVAGNGEDDDFAKKVCDYLEIFEALSNSPGRDKVGYLTCCQKTMNRYGNRRFQVLAKEFLDDNVLHVIVSDMHSELLALTSRKKDYRSLHRMFPHKKDPSQSLEISASILRHNPAATLFVSRVVLKET